jgi:hypothetical protein
MFRYFKLGAGLASAFFVAVLSFSPPHERVCLDSRSSSIHRSFSRVCDCGSHDLGFSEVSTGGR